MTPRSLGCESESQRRLGRAWSQVNNVPAKFSESWDGIMDAVKESIIPVHHSHSQPQSEALLLNWSSIDIDIKLSAYCGWIDTNRMDWR